MQSPASFELFADLAAEATVPARGIHSQTLSDVDGVELVLFAMAPGERLSEHTSARPAIVHVLVGTGSVELDGKRHALTAGLWFRMRAGIRHAIVAESGVVFALYLLPRVDAPA